MAIARVDSKKRVVLPNGRPGEVYDVQQQDDGRVVLVRLETPKPLPRVGRKACLKAMNEAPLTPVMSWEQLRGITREL
ncbi:MAG: hypothetical protein HUU46_01905 [Candidatus Hydrogenedentes bacterium]|nr:hypothetical protein [Candidatus Hydrogenedentota bacterium]